MLSDVLSAWVQRASELILNATYYVFPEYPQIGLAVVITVLLFFAYYLVQMKLVAGFKISFIILMALSFVLFVIHLMIKLYHGLM